MPLENQVRQALIEAGTQLRSDLWRQEDLEFLSRRARDLVGLNDKALKANDDSKRTQYRLAAQAVVENVKLLALLRMQTAQDHVLDALGRFFLKVVLPALAALLTALF